MNDIENPCICLHKFDLEIYLIPSRIILQMIMADFHAKSHIEFSRDNGKTSFDKKLFFQSNSKFTEQL